MFDSKEDETKRDECQDQEGFEITVGVMSSDDSDDSNEKEEDIFADVFDDDNADFQALDEIVAKARKPDSANNSQLDAIDDAFKTCDKTEDILSHLAKNARKDHGQSDAQKEKSGGKKEISNTMKKSGKLFLQIASRYYEEQGSSTPDSSKEKPDFAKAEGKSDLDRQLSQEGASLVEEMKAKVNEERLLRAKERMIALTEPAKEPQPSTSASVDVEETELLASMNVSTKEKEAYAEEVLKNEGLKNGEKDVVYGASSSAFVRSRKTNVVEVEESSGERTPAEGLDQSILEKLEAAETEADSILTEDELRKIQVVK